MGIGKSNNFKSNSIVYSTPQKLFDVLNKEFNFEIDLCANQENTKCTIFYDEKIDGLRQDWSKTSWMNPPYDKNIKKWILKAKEESIKHSSIICCLVPFRGNTIWFKDVCMNCEIRFIIGEVNFNELKRGLWLPMCFMIFGTGKQGTFSYIDYKEIRKSK